MLYKFGEKLAMRRTNGFQSPHNPFQIFTWVLFIFLVLHYGIFLLSTFPIIIALPLSIVFGALAMTSVGYCYLTIATDSIDELLYEHISGMPHPSILKRQADEKKRKLKEKRKAEENLKKDNKRKL